MHKVIAISQASFTAINRTVYSRLLNKGWDLRLIVPQQLQFPTGLKTAEPFVPGDPLLHLLPLTGNNPRIQWYKGLLPLLKCEKPKIVFLDNDPASYMAMRLSLWCSRKKIKFICQSCENLSLSIPKVREREGISGVPAAIMKNLFAFFSRIGCDHVFTISNDGTAVFKELGFRSVSKTPLGFNELLFYPDEKSRITIRNSYKLTETVIAYFGRLIPEKGIHVLLEALSLLKEYSWQFMMDEFDVYSTSYTNKIKKMIEQLGISNRVIYIHVSHTEVSHFMNAADVIVLPSVATAKWIEQYGRVIPEAMACGKTVVGSATGSIPELIADGGILFEESNVKILADILKKIILDPSSFNDLRKRAHARAHTYLSVNIQAAVLHDQFKSLI